MLAIARATPTADPRVAHRLAAVAAGVIMLVPTWLGAHHTRAVWPLQRRYAFGHGIHQPCGQAGALGPFPQAPGAASALSGYVLAGTAFLVGLWLGQVLDGSLMPCALTVALWSAPTALVAWVLVQHTSVVSRPA